MLFLLFDPQRPRVADKVWLNAMALIAVGMFIGHWVLAPAISTDTATTREALRSAKFERQALDAAAARPDPFPYRTPTPAFDVSGQPNYGALARQQAQAAYGWQGAEGAIPEPFGETPWASQPAQPSRGRSYDRHTGVRY